MRPSPALRALAQEIDRHLRSVRQTLRRPAEAEFARGNLTGPQRSVMHVLVTSGAISLKDLSRQVGLAHSTVSGIIDRLSARGLVERTTDRADRRVSRMVPSPAVRKFMRKTLPALTLDPLIHALHRTTPAERAAILHGLRALRHALEKTSSSAAFAARRETPPE